MQEHNVPRQVGKYELHREIGTGGMATVYLATDTVLHRQVALKMLHPHLLKNPRTLQRFRNEAHAVARLSHENIIGVFDYGEDSDDRRYLVMEYINGVTLEDLLAVHRVLPNLVLLELMHQVLSGLCAAHVAGVFHRDIKPSNIMVDQAGRVKIMDFGIAYLMNQEALTMTGAFVGSPNYISPEQAEGGKLSTKSDVFSVGAVMYECACGRVPFAEETVHGTIYSVVHDTPVPAFRRHANLLADVSALINECLCKEPRSRPDAREAMARIEELRAGLGVNLGRRRLQDFLSSPESYKRQEQRELHHVLSLRGRELSKRRKTVRSLKFFAQARQFGQLSQADERMISRMKRSSSVARIGVAAGFAFLLVSAIFVSVVILDLPGFVRSRIAAGGHSAVPVSDTAAVGSVPAGSSAIEPVAGGRVPADSTLGSTAVETAQSRPLGGAPTPRQRRPSRATTSSPRQAGNGNGFLAIKTKPPWTEIYVDGVFVGVFPNISVVPVSPGRHVIVLKNDRCYDHRESITVGHADTVRREIVLERTAP